MVFLILLCELLYNKFLFITKSIAIILHFVITRFDCTVHNVLYQVYRLNKYSANKFLL